jgi:hypothetical protein
MVETIKGRIENATWEHDKRRDVTDVTARIRQYCYHHN